MKFARHWRLHPALRLMQRFPFFSEMMPEYRYPLLIGIFFTLCFYNFVESPWYMNFIVLWATTTTAFVSFAIGALSTKEGGLDA